MSDVDLESDQTAQMAEIFGLLADPTRLGIVMVCAKGEISAGAVAQALALSPSLVSHHLRLLKAARMVKAERRGKQIHYTLQDACVRDVLQIMSRHLFHHADTDTED